jgi:hypothetical protein
VANTRIIGVYSGTEPDNRGRYLHEIQQWPDEQLETVHDYIPWLFLLPERSGFNVAAPVLNPESIQEFRTRPDLRGNLRALSSATRNFYGLELRAGVQITVTRAPNFATKATKWLSPGNHNRLRITRIFEVLSVLGLEPEAKAFFGCNLRGRAEQADQRRNNGVLEKNFRPTGRVSDGLPDEVLVPSWRKPYCSPSSRTETTALRHSPLMTDVTGFCLKNPKEYKDGSIRSTVDGESVWQERAIPYPSDWPVLVVEDTEDRISWFRPRMPKAVFAENAEAALRASR